MEFYLNLNLSSPDPDGDLQDIFMIIWEISDDNLNWSEFFNDNYQLYIDESIDDKYFRATIEYLDGEMFYEIVNSNTVYIPPYNSGAAEFALNEDYIDEDNNTIYLHS